MDTGGPAELKRDQAASAPFGDLLYWPEWDDLRPHLARDDAGEELAKLRAALTQLSSEDIERLAAAWQELDKGAVIDGWAQVIGAWNRSMNRHAEILYAAFCAEPLVRMAEGIMAVLAAARGLELTLPDEKDVRALARGMGTISTSGRPVASWEFRSVLGCGPASWPAALAAGTALMVAECYVEPAALRACLVSLRPSGPLDV